MALALYKTYVRERLVYQDLNGSFENITNYVNDYCQLQADCVSANTPLKVVKRDASGNFAANVITANSFVGAVTGNVTGNVTGDITGDLKSGSTIDGQALLNVFEEDTANSGKILPKARKATLADTATQLAGTTGGKWVVVATGSFSSSSGTEVINLRDGNQFNFYLVSVVTDVGVSVTGTWSYKISRSSTGLDQLSITNNGSQFPASFRYKVLAWETD